MNKKIHGTPIPKQINFEEIEGLTLKYIPEIRDAYDKFGWDSIPYPSDEWIEELINLDIHDDRRLGETIVFENLLVPFLISLFENEEGNNERIQEIMDFIEHLAIQNDSKINGTLINFCFWNEILNRYSDKLPRIFQYTGTRSKEILYKSIKYVNINPQVQEFLHDNQHI